MEVSQNGRTIPPLLLPMLPKGKPSSIGMRRIRIRNSTSIRRLRRTWICTLCSPLRKHRRKCQRKGPLKSRLLPGTIIPDATFLKTYTFSVNGSQWGDTQIVATGDTLYEPATPTAAAGMRFVGWFDSGNNQFTSFGTQTVEANGDITLHAEFTTAYYAFFYNAAGTAIIETRAPGTDNLVSTTNVTALQVAVDEAVTGWSYTLGGSAVGDTITVSGLNVNLYPIIEKVKWVSFNSNGGTYVSPMHVAPNTTLTQRDGCSLCGLAGYGHRDYKSGLHVQRMDRFSVRHYCNLRYHAERKLDDRNRELYDRVFNGEF